MHVGYVIPVFPYPSETFITREVLGLRALGVKITVFTVRDVPAADAARLPPESAALQAQNVKVDRAQMALSSLANPLGDAGLLNLRLQAAATLKSNLPARWLRATAIGRLARSAGGDGRG